MIVAWRLVKEKHVKDAFNGDGARLYGGRWNINGIPVVYTASSLSLAVLEQFIHLKSTDLNIKFAYLQATIPGSVIEDLNRASLPSDWRMEPPADSTKIRGTRWFQEKRSAVLCVPSVIIPPEKNYIINPEHPDFKLIKISKDFSFSLDPRMWK